MSNSRHTCKDSSFHLHSLFFLFPPHLLSPGPRTRESTWCCFRTFESSIPPGSAVVSALDRPGLSLFIPLFMPFFSLPPPHLLRLLKGLEQVQEAVHGIRQDDITCRLCCLLLIARQVDFDDKAVSRQQRHDGSLVKAGRRLVVRGVAAGHRRRPRRRRHW